MLQTTQPAFFSLAELDKKFRLDADGELIDVPPTDAAPPPPAEPPVEVYEEPRKPMRPAVSTRTIFKGPPPVRVMEPLPGHVISKIIFFVDDEKKHRYRTVVFTERKAGRPRKKQLKAAQEQQTAMQEPQTEAVPPADVHAPITEHGLERSGSEA